MLRFPEQSQVREYGPTGAPVDCPDGSNVLYEGSGGLSLAIDPSNGALFIGESNLAEGGFTAEYATPCSAPSAKFGGGEGGGGAMGINQSTGDLYVDDGEEAAIFSQVTVPDVTTGAPATGVTRTSAMVSGTVNPEATQVTVCEFEYGPTASYGQSVPCSQTLPLEGSAPIEVSAKIEGLTVPAYTLMHYRLKAANPKGKSVGDDETFRTEALRPPVLTGMPASSVSQFGATLHATIETSDVLVNYHFEYGTTTAYGAIEPIPDNETPLSTEPVPVSEAIGGLQAGTTYHYRLVASSPGGTNVLGPDETFTTLSVPPPLVSTGGASGVTRGEALLSGTIDPEGWSTSYRFEYGTTTAYGSSWPTVDVNLGEFTGAQPVSVTVLNLQPGTTYHYRLVATNAGGTSYGPDKTFTTEEYPVSVVQPTPLLSAPLGFINPETSVTKPPVEHKKHKKKVRHKRKGKKHGAKKG